MAIFLPVILVLILVVLALRHRARDGGMRRRLDEVAADLDARLSQFEAGEDQDAVPGDAGLAMAPAFLAEAVAAAHFALERREANAPQAVEAARRAIGDYRELRGWR